MRNQPSNRPTPLHSTATLFRFPPILPPVHGTPPRRRALPFPFAGGELDDCRLRDRSAVSPYHGAAFEKVAPCGHQRAALRQEVRSVVRAAHRVLLAVRKGGFDGVGLGNTELIRPS